MNRISISGNAEWIRDDLKQMRLNRMHDLNLHCSILEISNLQTFCQSSIREECHEISWRSRLSQPAGVFSVLRVPAGSGLSPGSANRAENQLLASDLEPAAEHPD